MKQKWLVYAVLGLSLAVNAGALGFYGWKRYQVWRQSQSFRAKWFKPGTTRPQLDRLLSDLDMSRAPVLDTVRTAIKELGLLAIEPNPDTARVGSALDRIERAQREAAWLMHEHTRALNRLYRPEKIEFWRKRMQVEHGSLLRAESAAAAGKGGK